MTRVEIVDRVVERVRRPHLREDMLTGWGTFLGPAAQRGRLIFGPSQGRNVAFVDPSDWLRRPIAPDDDPAAADRALGRLIARYLAVFPGASREMIARWWGGGRIAGVNRALKVMADPIVEVDVEGVRGLVRSVDVEALSAVAPKPRPEVRLIPGFDPFTNELPRRVNAVLADAHHDRVHRTAGWVTPVVVVDGRVAGTWEIESAKGGAGAVVVTPFLSLHAGVRRELKAEADRLAAFLDRPLAVSVAASLS
jgi:Winged helix DNA-binding domain